MFRGPRRVAGDDGVGRYASAYHSIGTHHRVSADDELALIAHDGGSEANPASFLDADCATLRCSLMPYRDGYILERMVVISDKYRRAEVFRST